MLYLVATPIGNLADITLRALDTLKKCDYILCEDTRHSHYLLQHYGIQTPLRSLHKFNEAARKEMILNDLKNGLNIALISDAGVPTICDPGAKIVTACREKELEVTIIPGACAFVSALALSGWEVDHFQFVGFLPKSHTKLENHLKMLLHGTMTSIAYETPKRLLKTLSILASFQLKIKVGIARELTKLHEEFRIGTPEQLLIYYSDHPPRGEIVLLMSQEDKEPPLVDEQELIDYVKKIFCEQKVPLSQAVRIAARETGVSKKIVYEIAHLALNAGDC